MPPRIPSRRRLRRLQNEVGLADTFEVMRSPLVCNLLQRVGSRFLDHAIEVSKRGIACPPSNGERVAFKENEPLSSMAHHRWGV